DVTSRRNGALLPGHRGRSVGFDHATKPCVDEILCFPDDPGDQGVDCGYVVDQTHRGTNPPDAGLQVAGFVHPCAACTRHQVSDITELPTAIEDSNDLAGYGVAGDPSSIAKCPEDQL